LSFTRFFDLEEIIFVNFNISENNIISVGIGQGTRVINGGNAKFVLMDPDLVYGRDIYNVWKQH
jgi:hypothetical protein